MKELTNDNEVSLRVEGKTYKPYICILVIVLSTLMQVLSSSGIASNSVIVTMYFNIVLILCAIHYMQFYGVIAATASSFIFALTIDQTWINLCFVVFANFLQAFLLYLLYNSHQKLHARKKNDVISQSEILILILGIFYFLSNLYARDHYETISIIILSLLIVVHVFSAILEKSKSHILLLIFLLIPNIIGAAIGSIEIYNGEWNTQSYLDNFLIWTFSNSILLLSFGYLLLGRLPQNQEAKKQFLSVKISTALFYTSTILWNVILYILYTFGWLDKALSSYVFPWLVGNLFFILNMCYSIHKETTDVGDEGFKWFENRSVVAENNTQMLVAIISFLLPICAQLLGTITYSISILFIFNITCAIISIGLVWIPKGKIKDMSTIKHVKTVFHLFTLSLLLLNIVMIINESVGL